MSKGGSQPLISYEEQQTRFPPKKTKSRAIKEDNKLTNAINSDSSNQLLNLLGEPRDPSIRLRRLAESRRVSPSADRNTQLCTRILRPQRVDGHMRLVRCRGICLCEC
jgi:hypothetical protein